MINDDGRRLYVGNLTYTVTERELHDAFAAYAAVEKVDLMKDRLTGQPRGFAFVTLLSESDVAEAIRNLDGADLRGRHIKVSQAKPRRR